MGGSSAQQQLTYSTTSKSSGWSPSGSAVETSTAPEIMLVAAQGVVSAAEVAESVAVLSITADFGKFRVDMDSNSTLNSSTQMLISARPIGDSGNLVTEA